jgi:hypothetical protein
MNVGISVYSNAARCLGALGCFSPNCGFCKNIDATQSQQCLPCPSREIHGKMHTYLLPIHCEWAEDRYALSVRKLLRSINLYIFTIIMS